MPLIFISSESKNSRRQLAEDLAKKLGYGCLCREDLIEEATKAGIPVGKLEVAMIKSPAMSERLARQKERYIAFITAALCERAMEGNFVYHGRAGHLLLQGISHIIKVRLVVTQETRIAEAMTQLKLGRDKAVGYVKDVDEDIERWVRYFYGVNRDKPGQYDVAVNLENMSLSNASAMLCYMAELPDFRPTPASLRALENRSLEARARKKLALDPQTENTDLKVRAENGVVTVTYMPRQPGVAQIIPEVLAGLAGCKEVMCTMATTNILWVQEKFDPHCEAFHQLNQIAQRWDAAIELVRFTVPPDLENVFGGTYVEVDQSAEQALAGTSNQFTAEPPKAEYNGGIEDDVESDKVKDVGGVSDTIQELVNIGRSGGAHTIRGNFHTLLSVIRGDVKYSLIVLGDLFLSKSHETQVRLTRELGGYLAERVGVPVITSDELQKKYLVGKKQFLKMLLYSAAVAALYLVIFFAQGPLLPFLGDTEHMQQRIIRMVAIFLFIPVVAYLYGTVTSLFLKFLKFE
ncbi:MAG: cytidylate kinase-like family protein [Candidatus Abyssobacteria bacterium SURF_17]|uniref:Cytidylate kinase-like family protein n=1 Tax=Candidatus Abyssobacteria bacterium SURF_17 TaxID=2093361 RepID=A0A419EU86_9BACT|nr:MAG: cytidylate kinase-like family protein [Candidatus Abyssubacteria bacterium SURF_17]